jgi:hypothetical protein
VVLQFRFHRARNLIAFIHKALRVTPAMEAGLANHPWTIEELVSLMERKEDSLAA